MTVRIATNRTIVIEIRLIDGNAEIARSRCKIKILAGQIGNDCRTVGKRKGDRRLVGVEYGLFKRVGHRDADVRVNWVERGAIGPANSALIDQQQFVGGSAGSRDVQTGAVGEAGVRVLQQVGQIGVPQDGPDCV